MGITPREVNPKSGRLLPPSFVAALAPPLRTPFDQVL